MVFKINPFQINTHILTNKLPYIPSVKTNLKAKNKVSFRFGTNINKAVFGRNNCLFNNHHQSCWLAFLKDLDFTCLQRRSENLQQYCYTWWRWTIMKLLIFSHRTFVLFMSSAFGWTGLVVRVKETYKLPQFTRFYRGGEPPV